MRHFPNPRPVRWMLVALWAVSGFASGATVCVGLFSPRGPSGEGAPDAVLVSAGLGVPTEAVRRAFPHPAASMGEGLVNLALRSTDPGIGPGSPPIDGSAVLMDGNEVSAPRWRARLDYFHGGEQGTTGLVNGDFSLTGQNGLALQVGYVAVRDFGVLPLDLIVQSSLMWHNEKGAQPDFFQYTASIKLEWTAFPWNDHLRSRFGFATGISYAARVPYAEQVSRDDEPSRNLLHYLEPSLSVHTGDLCRLIGLDHLICGFDSRRLENIWLVGSISHRSGAWGVYGENGDGDVVSDGSNYYAVGIQVEF